MRRLAFALSITMLVLLGGWLRIQETDWNPDQSYRVSVFADQPRIIPVPIIRAALDVLTGILILAAVQLLLERRIISAAVCAVYMVQPAFNEMPGFPMTETLYSLVNILLLLVFLLFFKSRSFSNILGLTCGVTLGISVLVRPSVFPFLLLFIGTAGLYCFFTRKKVLPYLMVLLGCFLVLSPWWIKTWITPIKS